MNALTTTDAVMWDANSGAALPAYLSNALDEMGTNIQDRQTVPSLSYEGKTWTIIKDGNKTKLQSKNSDGDMVPIPVMRLVVLNYNPDRGRSYYPGVYNPAASAAPICWSADGKAPDPSVKEKQSTLCNGCPMSVKGSKVTDGKEMVACSSHRMIAIAPSNDLTFDPLRLKIAVTSDYDKEIVEHGWFAFRQYADYLKSRGISHTALVVTKVKFDSNVAYPKLLFALDRPLTPDEVGQIKQALANPKVAELLAEKWTAAGSAGTQKDENDMKPHGLEGAYADGWQAHPDSAGYSWKGTEALTNDVLAAKYPAPVAPPIPEAAPTAPPIPASEMVIDVPATPAAPFHDPMAAAAADGWAVHPDPAWMFKGSEVKSPADVAALYPAPVAAPTAPPAPPPAPPAPPPVPTKTPMELALADGWAVHPDPAWMFKGSDVKSPADVEAMYVGNGASAATPAAAAAGQTAQTGASPSEAMAAAPAATVAASEGVPADVQNLLDKWAGG